MAAQGGRDRSERGSCSARGDRGGPQQPQSTWRARISARTAAEAVCAGRGEGAWARGAVMSGRGWREDRGALAVGAARGWTRRGSGGEGGRTAGEGGRAASRERWRAPVRSGELAETEGRSWGGGGGTTRREIGAEQGCEGAWVRQAHGRARGDGGGGERRRGSAGGGRTRSRGGGGRERDGRGERETGGGGRREEGGGEGREEGRTIQGHPKIRGAAGPGLLAADADPARGTHTGFRRQPATGSAWRRDRARAWWNWWAP